jgi:hypothetical protein
MQGFQRVTDFSKPHYLTTKDRVVREYEGKPTAFRVLFIRKGRDGKGEALLGRTVPGQATKIIKVTVPDVIDAEVAKHVEVWRPTGEYVPRVGATEYAGDVEPARKRTKPAAGESKIAKCKAFYALNKTLSRDAMQTAFVEQFGCTKQGAVTYFLTCQRELGELEKAPS